LAIFINSLRGLFFSRVVPNGVCRVSIGGALFWCIAFAENGSSCRSTVWVDEGNGKVRAYGDFRNLI